MATHDLKIRPKYFHLIERGIKKFEIRLNDRDFKLGDYLLLREFSDGEFSGATLLKKITYIFNDEAYCKEGFVILGFE